MKTTKAKAKWTIVGILFLLTAITVHLRTSAFPLDVQASVLVFCFLPFPWFIHHFVSWLKHRPQMDEVALLHGNLHALNQERRVHRSQIVASVGALYFLLLVVIWTFASAL